MKFLPLEDYEKFRSLLARYERAMEACDGAGDSVACSETRHLSREIHKLTAGAAVNRVYPLPTIVVGKDTLELMKTMGICTSTGRAVEACPSYLFQRVVYTTSLDRLDVEAAGDAAFIVLVRPEGLLVTSLKIYY